MKTKDESALIKAAARGDEAAFGEIVTTYERLVFSTLKSKVMSIEDAMDLSQEVFIKIWRALPNWRGDCKLSTWIYKVCVNTSLDFLRRSPEVETVSMSPDDEDDRPFEVADESITASPERQAEQNETTAAVRRAIASLPDDQRQVIMLRDIEGFSYDEISEMLSLGIGTVKSRINRARMRLKALLESDLAVRK